MPTTPARSQTLDRGLRLLEILAEAGEPMTIAQLSQAAGLHRSIVYRLLRTHEDHRLVTRDPSDAYRLGFGLTELARTLTTDIAPLAAGPLQALADATDLAAFIAVREGEEAVTIQVVEPTSPGVMFTQRIGYRHDVHHGAPGHALASLAPARADDPADVSVVRTRGWATSTGQVLEGVSSVAAPLPGYRLPAAVAVTYVGERHTDRLAAEVTTAAARISRLL